MNFSNDDDASAQERIKTIGLISTEDMVKTIDSDTPRSTIAPPQSSRHTRLYRIVSRLREPEILTVSDLLEVFDAHGFEIRDKEKGP